MEDAHHERPGFMGGVAKVLNAGGNAAVYAYDAASGALGKVFSMARNAPVLPEKVMSVFAPGLGMIRLTETRRLEERIREYERKIKALYFEIGKEGASYSGDESALETEPVKKLIADVRQYEKEIQRLRDRVVEVKEQKKAAALRRKELRKAARVGKKRDTVADEDIKKRVEAAIAKAVKRGDFDTRSEQEIFDKVANDLLDSEAEVKVLAAAELGKIGNAAAVPILVEAVHFDSPELVSEIINSLVMLGDLKAIPLFKENANHSNYRIRIGSLRGLYKLAEDQEAIPVLTEALRDEHHEVRKTAATFIGWKDYTDAAPSLVQCLRDEDAGVRKAAVSALANIKDTVAVLPLIKVLGDKDLQIREKAFDAIKVITGAEIAFDVNASGKALTEAINNLRDWWQQERLGKADAGEAEVAVEAEPEEQAVREEGAEEEAAEAEASGERQAAIEHASAEEEAVREEGAEEEAAEAEKSEFTEESLMRMIKTELVSICKEHGIECDEKQTKAEITQLILGGKE
ncbi:MAG: HEAT repeat domain-containing protein [Desulfobacterales bacterium]|nr:HEAT repeat domain-containing protein [Desulfobacterales bacterium]